MTQFFKDNIGGITLIIIGILGIALGVWGMIHSMTPSQTQLCLAPPQYQPHGTLTAIVGQDQDGKPILYNFTGCYLGTSKVGTSTQIEGIICGEVKIK